MKFQPANYYLSHPPLSPLRSDDPPVVERLSNASAAFGAGTYPVYCETRKVGEVEVPHQVANARHYLMNKTYEFGGVSFVITSFQDATCTARRA